MDTARLGGCVDGENEDHGYLETDPTGRYGRFKEVLGKGAMKTVYMAFDEVLGMEVAWNQAKLNDVFRSPEELQRLYSEVHLLSTLKHESIIRYHTSWIDVDHRTFNFITEMFTSGTLREYRRRFPRVDIRAVKNWARQILRGLVYLHGHDPPVIHRDLKCDNIFVNGHLGQVKIGDLGFAAILRGSQTAHSVIGTPEFMAPELYEEEYNELVDIYSFGMCVLEMLTSQYPYSECSNPAQIYKKVTSGKLPEAFYRIQDVEARKFVGQCLEEASKRLPAKELLLDPFLASDETTELLPIPIESHEPFPTYVEHGNPEYETKPLNRTRSTDVTITGKMNLEDDTIYLKVQIVDKDGSVRNVYFPYDVVGDTALDVATEMVKELEITDREPHEIAKVIEAEISALVSQSKECDPLQLHHQHHSSSYEEEDEDDPHHPLYSLSSRSSSQASLPDLMFPHGTRFPRCLDVRDGCDWLPDGLFVDDDTSSECSLQSCNYSNLNYNSGNEQDFDISPRRRDNNQYSIAKAQRSTRFCPAGNIQCKVLPRPQVASSSSGSRTSESHRLTRNRSLVDVRSQLLHRSLVEEVNKRRLFNTVGAVENIGYQAPCEPSGKVLRPIGGGCSVGTRRDGKKKGYRKI